MTLACKREQRRPHRRARDKSEENTGCFIGVSGARNTQRRSSERNLFWIHRHQNSPFCYLPVVGGASSWAAGVGFLRGGTSSSSSESSRGCDPFPLLLAVEVEPFAVFDGMIQNLKGREGGRAAGEVEESWW